MDIFGILVTCNTHKSPRLFTFWTAACMTLFVFVIGCEDPDDNIHEGLQPTEVLDNQGYRDRCVKYEHIPRLPHVVRMSIVPYTHGEDGHSTISRLEFNHDVGELLDAEVQRINCIKGEDFDMHKITAPTKDISRYFGVHDDPEWPLLEDGMSDAIRFKTENNSVVYQGKWNYYYGNKRKQGAMIVYQPESRVMYYWTWSLTTDILEYGKGGGSVARGKEVFKHKE